MFVSCGSFFRILAHSMNLVRELLSPFSSSLPLLSPISRFLSLFLSFSLASSPPPFFSPRPQTENILLQLLMSTSVEFITTSNDVNCIICTATHRFHIIFFILSPSITLTTSSLCTKTKPLEMFFPAHRYCL